MFALLDKFYRLRSSVALVESSERLEMFRTNVRESLRIKLDYKNITQLLAKFDGKTSAKDIFNDEEINFSDGEDLVLFLNQNHVLIQVNCSYLPEEFSKKSRIINLIEDYVYSTSDVINALDNISRSQVLIVGLGAVGTWVALSLAQSGVENFILVDNDVVDISNLHRQEGFFEDDLGKLKVEVIERRLHEIRKCNVLKINDQLDENFFSRHLLDFSLAINCADYPSVDYTTEVISEYCMQKEIPHLIGGGYNLHLSLIGQAVLPGKSACVMCFKDALEKINQADLDGVKKLSRLNRKIGSFGPVCAISASLASTEAFKIIIGAFSHLTTLNRRIEFRMRSNEFSSIEIEKNNHCKWCGTVGKFKFDTNRQIS
jgi:molybdopterin/thiamine biosynthesis adenylyltransferase